MELHVHDLENDNKRLLVNDANNFVVGIFMRRQSDMDGHHYWVYRPLPVGEDEDEYAKKDIEVVHEYISEFNSEENKKFLEQHYRQLKAEKPELHDKVQRLMKKLAELAN